MEIIQVACGIIHKEEKILVAQRSESMSLPLKWEFPGGKIRSDETEEECLHREVKEELNIKISIEQRLNSSIYTYENFTINLIPFIASYTGGEIILAEHARIRWLLKDELISLDWAPADFSVLKQVLISSFI